MKRRVLSRWVIVTPGLKLNHPLTLTWMLNFALHQKNLENLWVLAQGKYERSIAAENDRKEYISKKNLFVVRRQYKSRFGLQPFAGNYQHDARFVKSNWLCHCEELRENESRPRSKLCKVYGDISERLSELTEDESLVQFFLTDPV